MGRFITLEILYSDSRGWVILPLVLYVSENLSQHSPRVCRPGRWTIYIVCRFSCSVITTILFWRNSSSVTDLVYLFLKSWGSYFCMVQTPTRQTDSNYLIRRFYLEYAWLPELKHELPRALGTFNTQLRNSKHPLSIKWECVWPTTPWETVKNTSF